MSGYIDHNHGAPVCGCEGHFVWMEWSDELDCWVCDRCGDEWHEPKKECEVTV